MFGSLVTQTLEEVWYSPVVQAYREKLARKDRTMKLCEGCDYRGSPLRDFRPGLKLKQMASDLAASLGRGQDAPARSPPVSKTMCERAKSHRLRIVADHKARLRAKSTGSRAAARRCPGPAFRHPGRQPAPL